MMEGDKMKKMSFLCALSITTGFFCGVWSFISVPLGLLSWAGFAGCTTYFATGRHGAEGLKNAIIPNLMGIVCGMTIIFLGQLSPQLGNLGIWSGVISFVICIITKFKWFNFTPGTFLGCFATFAAGGDWKLLVPSIVVGAFLGWTCDTSGAWLYKKVSGKDPQDESAE